MNSVSAGLNILGGIGSIKAGRAQARAYEMEARAREKEARLINLQTAQSTVNAWDELASNLSAISAVRAARNLSVYSPTGEAVQGKFRKESLKAMDAAKLESLIAANNRISAARSARLSGKATKFSGYINALPMFAAAGQDIAAIKPSKGIY